ncbi:MAG TPA: hypothetical protein VGE09_08610 [Pseudoxanthomonas sp.]
MTKLEEVARAIAGEIDCVDWTAPDNTLSHPARLNAIALEAARAAIEAMREPTEAMYEAAILTHVRENKGIEHSPHLSWQAMIDAILKEEGNG